MVKIPFNGSIYGLWKNDKFWFLNSLDINEAKDKIISRIEQDNLGKKNIFSSKGLGGLKTKNTGAAQYL